MDHRERSVRTIWASADTAVAFVATLLAAWLRYDLDLAMVLRADILVFAAVTAVVFALSAIAVGPYLIDHVRGSFEETADLGRAVITAGGVLVIFRVATDWFDGVPRSLPATACILAMLCMFALRLVVRSYRWGRTATSEGQHKAVVFGAGSGGRALIRALRHEVDTAYVPIAILDDDPRKKRLKIDGVPVKGSRHRLKELVEESHADTLILALPSADGDTLRELHDLGHDLGLDVLVLPPTDQIIGGKPQGSDLRQLNLEDLLGRRKVQLDDAAISEVISGKRVLVTGAGGSIGSELARQISRFGPARLVLLDRDESALHGVQMSLTGRALLDDGTLALVDIRDREALFDLFDREKPEIVFHAAALKHLTLLEQYPLEGWKTNVIGTHNVLEAARRVNVEKFVNISTDKAANPSCVLGYSKRLAERLTAHYASLDDNVYVSVRFGNVLGSRGSVITAFTAQIERGGPVTVTHPEVERYFMLIPEACQLVLQSAAIGRDGDVMVLEMGTPVKIVEVARTLIDLSGRKDVDIVYTGLRPGEKMSEELFIPGEEIQRSAHPLVNYVSVPAIDPLETHRAPSQSPTRSFEWMRDNASVTTVEAPQRDGQETTTGSHRAEQHA